MLNRFSNSASPHTRAVLQALFVTFLWSTSWVLVKIGLQDEIPSLTFAGWRYTLAALCLLPLLVRQPTQVAALRSMSRHRWMILILLGLLFYTITQGAQFVGLASLPSITVSLLLSMQALLVTLAGISTLGERPTSVQWIGMAFYLAGIAVYFLPVDFPAGQLAALFVVILGVLAGSASSLISRSLNRAGNLSPLAITVISMGVGGPVLLIAGIVFQGLPPLSLTSWAIILWLAIVNTALAFTLWNNTMRTLSAMESSVINNMMMVQIPIFAWLFLGEAITLKSGLGFTIAGIGILVVQLRRVPRLRRQIALPQAGIETDIANQT